MPPLTTQKGVPTGAVRGFLSMLVRRGAVAAVTLGGVGFLVDRFLAILRDREEFLAGVFTNLETAVLVYDLDPSGNSHLAAMNKASEQVFGVAGAQLLGRSRRELLKALADQALAAKGSPLQPLTGDKSGDKTGDKTADDLDYVPMPDSVKNLIYKAWGGITDGAGKPVAPK